MLTKTKEETTEPGDRQQIDLGWVWAEGQVVAGPTWVFVLSQVVLPPEASWHLDGATQ